MSALSDVEKVARMEARFVRWQDIKSDTADIDAAQELVRLGREYSWASQLLDEARGSKESPFPHVSGDEVWLINYRNSISYSMGWVAQLLTPSATAVVSGAKPHAEDVHTNVGGN